MLRGGETRCSAVWSAHLFWVQRAIGSNPVTLMWGRSQPQTGSIAASDNKIIHIEFENENLRCGLAFDIQCWLTAAPPETLTDKIRFNLAVPSSWAFSARPHLHDFEPGRDSLTLLPGNLASLGNTLCPELGSKGSIQHENLVVSDLQVNSENLINYLRQDILILGGVMLKAQEINWSKYQIDVGCDDNYLAILENLSLQDYSVICLRRNPVLSKGSSQTSMKADLKLRKRGSPLSDDLVSSKEMGKFKLENHVKKGIFLAPKSYMLEIEDDQHIIKHKGPAKDLVTSEWFQKVLEDPSLTEKIATSANFRIDWKELKIVKKDILLKLGLPQSNKRENIYDSNNLWIDTRPLDIIDLGTKDATTIFKYELLTKNGEIDKNHLSNEKITKLLEEMDDENKSLLSKYYEEEGNQSTNEGQKTTTVQPTLYNNKPKKNKKSKDNDTTKIYRPKPDE
ncbi:UNVERIFIED_CONTAM: DNA polymerase [Sesamum calycinum]|uniref:DNA polymerase n=1 Tax=Sesamum calycinum TaxID=2727403 RepID=A0AAW2JDR7_9LAMI